MPWLVAGRLSGWGFGPRWPAGVIGVWAQWGDPDTHPGPPGQGVEQRPHLMFLGGGEQPEGVPFPVWAGSFPQPQQLVALSEFGGALSLAAPQVTDIN